MTFQPVPQTVGVYVRGTLFNQRVENTIYVSTADPTTPGDVADIAAAAGAWYRANIVPLLAQDYVYRETFAKDLSSASGAEVNNTTGVGTIGGQPFAAMPGNVTLAISFRTGLAGRSFRGRNYLPCLAEPQVTGNTVASATADAFVTGYNELLNVLVGSEYTWTVVSRFTSGVLRAVGISTPVVNAIVTNLFVDSMRRRLTGRGS